MELRHTKSILRMDIVETRVGPSYRQGSESERENGEVDCCCS
jgi:hypothetical protein